MRWGLLRAYLSLYKYKINVKLNLVFLISSNNLYLFRMVFGFDQTITKKKHLISTYLIGEASVLNVTVKIQLIFPVIWDYEKLHIWSCAYQAG